MNNIEEVYIQKITQRILLDMLKDGIVPTSTSLISSTRSLIGDKTLSRPLSSQPKLEIAYGEEASAAKFNNLLSTITDDLDVLYDIGLSSEKAIGLSSTRTLSELNQINKSVNTLIDRASRLLLTTEQTEGLLTVVGDNFEDTSLINLDETTAYFDASGQCIHGAFLSNSTVQLADEIDTALLAPSDIKVTPLDTAFLPSPGTHGGSLLNMFNNENDPWMYSIKGPNGSKSAAIEIKINFSSAMLPPNAFVTVGKIILDPAITNNSLLVLIQHSKDGITWSDFPVNDPIRRINSATTYLAEGVELLHLRIVLTKDMHDDINGGFIYRFGIKHLGLHGYRSVYTDTSSLVSNRILLTDSNGDPMSFTMAALSTACEHIPADTSIDYSLAFLLPKVDPEPEEDPYSQTDFFKINPLNREDPTGPSIVEVAGANQTTTAGAVGLGIEIYPFMDNKNNRLLVTDDSLEGGENIQLWRNVGSKEEWKTVRGTDRKVIDAGWAFDNPYYVSYGLVKETGGITIDFGPNLIEIDGVEVNGKARLSQGIHKFRVHEQNWYSLKGLHDVSAINPLTKKLTGVQSTYGVDGLQSELTVSIDAQVIDPLYPYNHKLLVEGLTYESSYKGERPYRGVQRFAAFLPKETTEAEMGLTVGDQDYTKFCVSRVEGSTVPRIMVKWNQINEEAPTESFVVITSTGDAAVGLVFKATFNTTNIKRTASLDGYEIKVS